MISISTRLFSFPTFDTGLRLPSPFATETLKPFLPR
jgi:hypothetical protein